MALQVEGALHRASTAGFAAASSPRSPFLLVLCLPTVCARSLRIQAPQWVFSQIASVPSAVWL